MSKNENDEVRRLKINERERRRMHDLNSAMDGLRSWTDLDRWTRDTTGGKIQNQRKKIQKFKREMET